MMVTNDDLRALLARLDELAQANAAEADERIERANKSSDMPLTQATLREAAARRNGRAEGLMLAAGLVAHLLESDR